MYIFIGLIGIRTTTALAICQKFRNDHLRFGVSQGFRVGSEEMATSGGRSWDTRLVSSFSESTKFGEESDRREIVACAL